MRTFLFVSVVAFPLLACGSDSFRSSSSDGGQPGDGAVSDGAPPGTDGAPNPGDGGGDAAGKTWCETNHVAATIFCADFDQSPNLAQGWSNTVQNGQGLGALDMQVYRSPPAGYRAETANVFQTSTYALTYTTQQSATTLDYVFEAELTDVQSQTTIADLTWEGFDVRVQASSTGLQMLSRWQNQDTLTSAGGLPSPGWHRYRLTVQTGGSATLLLDGSMIAQVGAPGGLAKNANKTIWLGAETLAMASASVVNFDNVLLNGN